MVHITDHFVSGATGLDLYVRDFGGRGPTVLLIHGAGHSSANWEPLAPLLTP